MGPPRLRVASQDRVLVLCEASVPENGANVTFSRAAPVCPAMPQDFRTEVAGRSVLSPPIRYCPTAQPLTDADFRGASLAGVNLDRASLAGVDCVDGLVRNL